MISILFVPYSLTNHSSTSLYLQLQNSLQGPFLILHHVDLLVSFFIHPLQNDLVVQQLQQVLPKLVVGSQHHLIDADLQKAVESVVVGFALVSVEVIDGVLGDEFDDLFLVFV